MRLLLCWANISGYMAACWRALAATPGVELKIIAFEAGAKTFSNDLIRGIDCRVLTSADKNDAALIRSLVKDARPEILYVSGWFHPPYRALLSDAEFEGVPKWMGVDTPWRGTFRQQLGRLALRPLMSNVDRVFVAGERAWQYMRRLGFDESQISRGLYGVDYDGFARVLQTRQQQPGGWPRRFLYLGRYAPEKALDVLASAYAKYRGAVSDPWPLTCCGAGAEKHLLANQAGIADIGFQQPADTINIMAGHGALILPSRFEPWGVVVAEASAAGLPVICTEACGSAVELVRPYYNGLPVATGNVDALASAMLWTHEHHADLPEMGRRGNHLAEAYSAQAWATSWAETARNDLNRAK